MNKKKHKQNRKKIDKKIALKNGVFSIRYDNSMELDDLINKIKHVQDEKENINIYNIYDIYMKTTPDIEEAAMDIIILPQDKIVFKAIKFNDAVELFLIIKKAVRNKSSGPVNIISKINEDGSYQITVTYYERNTKNTILLVNSKKYTIHSFLEKGVETGIFMYDADNIIDSYTMSPKDYESSIRQEMWDMKKWLENESDY